jgi:hypothetical protein
MKPMVGTPRNSIIDQKPIWPICTLSGPVYYSMRYLPKQGVFNLDDGQPKFSGDLAVFWLSFGGKAII